MPVRKKLCSLLLVCSCTISFAQTKVFEYELSPGELEDATMKTIFQGRDTVLFSVVHETGVTKILLNNGLEDKKVQQEETSIPGKQNYILKADKSNFGLDNLGNQIIHNYITECNFSKRQNNIYLTGTDLITGTSQTTDTIILGGDESFLTLFSEDSTLCIVTYIEQSNQINFYEKHGHAALVRHEKTIPLLHAIGSWKTSNDKEITVKKISDLFSHAEDKGFILMEEDKQYPALLGLKRVKLYHLPGRFIISFDNTELQTILFDIRLSDLSHRVSVTGIPQRVMEGFKTVSGYTNSYLANNMLFKTGNCNGTFFMAGMDLSTGQVKLSSFIGKKEKSEAVNTAFFKTADGNFPAEDKNKRIAGLLNNSSSNAMLTKINDSLARVEFCYPHQKMTWLDIVISVAATASGTYFINSLPNTFGYFYLILSHTTTVNIQNTLNTNTGKFELGADPLYTYDLQDKKMATIKKFLKQPEFEVKNLSYYISGNDVYTSFLNGNKICLYKF